jgi:MoaA/NifB/PqqE/SkfB family radical SAM enzyme/tetratricopeptide (TPR) repeat protein
MTAPLVAPLGEVEDNRRECWKSGPDTGPQNNEAAMRQTLASDPGDIDALRRLGLLRKEQGRFPEAIWAFGKILKKMPDDLPALWGRIECQMEGGDSTAARLFCLQAMNSVAPKPENLEFFISLGQCLLRVEDYSAASEAYRRVLHLDPDNASATEGLKKAVYLLRQDGRATSGAAARNDSPARTTIAAGRSSGNEPGGPGQRYRVTIVNEGEAASYELSLDVYPRDNPNHPLRHYGYWNQGLKLAAGESFVVDVLWQSSLGQAWFNGARVEPAWEGELKEHGDCEVHLVVYQNDRRAASFQFSRKFDDTDALEHARPVLFHVGATSKLTSAVWFLTWACNFKCPYCWEVQRIAHGEMKPDPFMDAEKWIAAWNRVRPATLDISGGEPFLQPNFIRMLQGFDNSIRVAITTNLSFDLTEFVQKISPNKVFSMTLSFHPTQKLPLNVFLGRALLLKNRGFRTMVNFVTYPEQLWMLGNYKQIFESHGLGFHVDPYATTPYYPFELSEKERAYLRPFVGGDRAHASSLTGEKKEIHVLCSGGVSHLNVQPNGDAYRCIFDKIQGPASKVGNLFDPDFKLYQEWRHCGSYQDCPGCDRDKVKVKRVEPPAGPQAAPAG